MTLAFSSFTDFLDMGGYAGYVWSAYGITLLVLGLILIKTHQRTRQIKRKLEKLRATDASYS